MKLIEIKEIRTEDYDLSEAVIPIHIVMTMEQILRDGKITNNVQYYIMGALIEMFKNGGPTRWPRDLNPYSMTTSYELIESIRGLSPKDQVDAAAWLLNELHRPVDFETNPRAYCNPQMGTEEWLRFVLQRQ